MEGRFHQTGTLISLMLRRNRLYLSVWVVSLTVLTIVTALSYAGMYGNDQERQAMAETMKNPAMTAMVGKGYGLSDYTDGAMLSHQMLLFTMIAAAIMSILLASRHTRGEEEDGRMEMIRALPVGRAANLSAVLVVLLMANGGLAVFLTGGLVSLGIDSISLGGSLLYGIAVGSAGMIFGTVTLVAGQLLGSTVGTLGWSFAFLGLSYLLRAIGDVGDLFLTWCSPLGWLLETRVFVENIWWPLLPAAGWIVLVAWLGFRLNASRDIGSGLIPAKAGRERGSRWLAGPFGLMLRIQRTSMISWAVGMLLLGVSYGSVFGDLEAFLSGNEELAAMLPDASGHSLTEQFMTLMMIVIAVLGTIPPLLFLHKVRSEEKKGTLEHLLAGPVSRMRVLWQYVLISILWGGLVILLAIVGLWASASMVMEEPIPLANMIASGMVYLPAQWCMLAVSTFFIGVRPRLLIFTWCYLVYSFLVVYLGGMLDLPEMVNRLTPFGYIPRLPVESFEAGPFLLICAFTVLFMVVGAWGYRKRDLQG